MSLIMVHDTETTGFSDVSNVVTEYAAIAFDANVGSPVGFISVLIDHGVPIPAKITELTGIDNALVEKYGVKPDVAVKRIEKFHSRYNIDYFMAHNEPFDRKMTNALLKKKLAPLKGFICTQRDFTHQKINEAAPENNKLPTLTKYYGITHGFGHRAMPDTMACLAVGLSGGLMDFLGKPKEENVEVRILLPYDPPNFDANNKRARDIGFYWAGKGTKHHYASIKKSKLDETLKKVADNKDFKLLEVVEAE